jgi:hypothetical protein
MDPSAFTCSSTGSRSPRPTSSNSSSTPAPDTPPTTGSRCERRGGRRKSGGRPTTATRSSTTLPVRRNHRRLATRRPVTPPGHGGRGVPRPTRCRPATARRGGLLGARLRNRQQGSQPNRPGPDRATHVRAGLRRPATLWALRKSIPKRCAPGLTRAQSPAPPAAHSSGLRAHPHPI